MIKRGNSELSESEMQVLKLLVWHLWLFIKPIIKGILMPNVSISAVNVILIYILHLVQMNEW